MLRIILIGMPASGKSTVGKMLADKCGVQFTDGDDLIRKRAGILLHKLIGRDGNENFMALEEETLSSFSPEGSFVLATGGSAVYSPRAMAHLKSLGTVVYLQVPLSVVCARIPDFTARGVVMRGPIGTLSELYRERTPLYEHYADLTVDCNKKKPGEIADYLAGKYA